MNNNLIPTLEEALGLETPTSPASAIARVSKPLITAPIASSEEEKLDKDVEYVRDSLYLTIESGNRAIQQMSDLANESMEPRAYRVVSELITSVSQASEKLMKLHNDRMKILLDKKNYNSNNTVDPAQSGTHINNAVIFNGTSEDLIRAIRKDNKNEIKVIDIDEVIDGK